MAYFAADFVAVAFQMALFVSAAALLGDSVITRDWGDCTATFLFLHPFVFVAARLVIGFRACSHVTLA